jgi:tyrosinase
LSNGTLVKIRQDVENLTANELDNLRQAFSMMMAIRDNRGYSFIAGHHGVPGFYCWHHQRELGEHRGFRARLFLPWHRAYLKVLEDLLQDHVPGITVPWWRWPVQEAPRARKVIPKAFSDQRWNGQLNPLYSFHISIPNVTLPNGPEISLDEDTFRRTGQNPFSRLPSELRLRRLIEIEDYGEFSDQLEDIHDNMHGWVGGTMSDVYRAGFDPLFFVHHSNVDRWWRIWQLRHGDLTIPLELLNIALDPFPYTVRDVLSVYNLGYDYASSSSELVL